MSLDSPLVSVVIPAYNSAKTIDAAIGSVLAQNVSDLEVVVVDDRSTDETAHIVESVPDARVRLLRRTENGRQAAARNSGIEFSRGRWIAFLDADDIFLPGKLQVQLARMTETPGCLASQTSAYLVDEELSPLLVRRCTSVPDPLLSFLKLQNLPAVASTLIVHRDVIDTIGMFDTSLELHEDWDFVLRLTPVANPICIDEPLTLYRQHVGSVSRDVDAHVDCGLKILGRVFADPQLPDEIRTHKREIYARYYTMLCGGMFRVGRWRGVAYWGIRALLTDPRMLVYMSATPVRRLRRRVAAQSAPEL